MVRLKGRTGILLDKQNASQCTKVFRLCLGRIIYICIYIFIYIISMQVEAFASLRFSPVAFPIYCEHKT